MSSHNSRNRWPAAAVVAAVSLAIAALGFGLSGAALAIDQPHPRKAAKFFAPKAAAPRFAAPRVPGPRAGLPKTALPNTARPNTALPKSPTATTNQAAAGVPPAHPTPAPPGLAAAHATAAVKPANSRNPATSNNAAANRTALLGKGNPAATNRSSALAALGNRNTVQRTPAQQRQFEFAHRRALVAQRNRLPFRPLPGERGFTGVPPAGETRFISNEMVFHVPPNVSREAVDNAARRLGLSTVGSQTSALTGGTLYRFSISGGRQTPDVVRALEAEHIGVAQPNYVYRAVQTTSQPDGRADQDTTLAARSKAPDPTQYVVSKLRLGDVHRVATGSNVLVAVIDSEIDSRHPDLAGAVVEEFDAVGRRDSPHVHGTGMAGAIVAHRQLMGIAPDARILAIHAFSPDSAESPQATTQHILAGMEWAIKKGARVINMSFAGPYDPMLQVAMKNARAKGIVLIAAAGNAGPKSPPLYPAADPNVIAVTATDANDKLFDLANRGPQVALAAPGVDILEPAPNAGYQLTTGTSVAAAHVSGVAALLIEHNPAIDVDTVHEILTSSARTLGPNGRDDAFGWGLVDPAQALVDLDAKIARDRIAVPAKLPVGRAGPISAR
jgi:hypothetical protein